MKLYTSMDALLCEMEAFVREHYGHDSASWRSGDFAAGALLEFKGRHGDGRLHHWTVGDVREFLLGWFPRTVFADEICGATSRTAPWSSFASWPRAGPCRAIRCLSSRRRAPPCAASFSPAAATRASGIPPRCGSA